MSKYVKYLKIVTLITLIKTTLKNFKVVITSVDLLYFFFTILFRTGFLELQFVKKYLFKFEFI